ncbi:hypothetical protein [Sinomonas atrocyanea]|uniref:hypothetical protein n=1 Tax=Sinomonas atrocyanea TaxID=37927 RepID=UPI0027842FDE|nr:hypothetical protein [Sinomonas atrocyanea]MDQ0258993.1 hypothetical protein [Sinomonas atrocyanea]MDR6621900.1 hypothetical protein [Sinomonas atrocyanea]
MSQQPTPPPYQPGPPAYQPGPPAYQGAPQPGGAPAYGPPPPQGSYQGPWPSQLPSGSFPGMPAVGIARPLTITLAAWFLVASSIAPLAGIPAILDWMGTYMHTSLMQATTRANRANAAAFASQFTAIMTPALWVSALVGVAVTVLIALGIRAGMNWVRILLTVFAGLSVLGYVSNLALSAVLPTAGAFPMPAFVYVLSFLSGALYIAAAVLTWLRPSSQYIAARRAAKLGGGYLR